MARISVAVDLPSSLERAAMSRARERMLVAIALKLCWRSATVEPCSWATLCCSDATSACTGAIHEFCTPSRSEVI